MGDLRRSMQALGQRLEPLDSLGPVVEGGRTGDKQIQARIRVRLKRLEAGNFGDCDPVGEGVQELREHLGAGYRVYFGRHGQTVVILLCGGSKKSQATDIKIAREYWRDWKRRQT